MGRAVVMVDTGSLVDVPNRQVTNIEVEERGLQDVWVSSS
jgi:hypothetical protein